GTACAAACPPTLHPACSTRTRAGMHEGPRITPGAFVRIAIRMTAEAVVRPGSVAGELLAQSSEALVRGEGATLRLVVRRVRGDGVVALGAALAGGSRSRSLGLGSLG